MFRAADELSQLGARRSPEPKCAVDVKPGAALLRGSRDLLERIERTGVHLAGLSTDDRRTVVSRQRPAQGLGHQPALRVRRDLLGSAKPEQSQRSVDRDVALCPDEHS